MNGMEPTERKGLLLPIPVKHDGNERSPRKNAALKTNCTRSSSNAP